MVKNKIKVLMLGWEFPPIINGGLGVACFGIAGELVKKVGLTLIIPQSSLDAKIEGLELIGLNHQKVKRLIKEDREKLEIFEDVHYIEANLDPYSQEVFKEFQYYNEKTKKGETIREEEIYDDHNIFLSDELYGADLNKKVIEYTKRVIKISEQSSFDIIYAHDWMTFVAGLELKKRTGKPLVIHVHSLSFDRVGVKDRSWVYSIEKLAMKQADVIIPVSSYTGRVCAQHYDADFKKIHPVYNGVEKIDAVQEEKSFSERLVLFLGRVTVQKGPNVFLEIATKVLEKNENVRFVVAGDGDQLKGLMSTGIYEELGSKIHFTGFLDREKVNKVLSMADVYCMPSVSEPFGLSALEAAQFRVPAVISKQSGVSEVLSGALKADYWDSDKMASHVLNLLDDDLLKKEVIKQSLKDLEELTWASAVAKIEDIFKKVMSR